ncbi:hypothetical protein JQ609_21040 [Bradyrhizobium sp. AUGA SZCCT0169]|jgi:hypothetical protein|uniref:hypothetical protein n=1 Tax=unclassified Bradyrhizobium TaxID=2631580 RepID=UPI001BA4ED37|nr:MULTISPECIES: hypothetical protein [unclassified Bradyrhizobium]MBR1190421.1 hypothetical protein [Bradyrhizobium sp. AUGA SZCCT0160]MBR1249401.1 hypothetical protein [Bradyrhizobium sp. AUGA SZCCT0169]
MAFESRTLIPLTVDQIIVRTIVLLALYGTVLVFGFLLYSSYRDSNVSRISVSKLSDLDEEFEVGVSSLRVKNPKFLKVCFTGDYVHALKDAQQWFAAKDTEFKAALRAAGGPADVFNDDDHSSIVLLTHDSALILQLSWRAGLSVANFGCASVDGADIELKRYETNSSVSLFLPGATPKSPRGPGQPRATLCTQKLERFVESIDELLAQTIQQRFIWAAIRRYLPRTGCRADEVISIARTSRFFTPLSENSTAYGITFQNSDWTIYFELDKNTGETTSPWISSRHPPFS